MASILSRPQCVNNVIPHVGQCDPVCEAVWCRNKEIMHLNDVQPEFDTVFE